MIGETPTATTTDPFRSLASVSLRGKFWLPILILVGAVAIGLGIGLYVKRTTDRYLFILHTVHLPRLELAARARHRLDTAKLHAVHFFLAKTPIERDQDRRNLNQQLAMADGYLRDLIALGGKSPVTDAAEEIRALLGDQRRANPENVGAEAGAGYGPGDLADLYVSRIAASLLLDRLVDRLNGQLMTAQEDLERLRGFMAPLVAGIGLLALVGSVATMRWRLRTQLAAPLQRLRARMIDIASEPVERLADRAEADPPPALTSPVPDLQRGDELGSMAAAVDLLRRDKVLAVTLMRRLAAARAELTEQAKMASLGAIVAGVAHEINTPIGVCVTGSSGIMDEIEQLLAAQATGTLDPGELASSLERINEYAALVLANMTRAGALVASFKQISVDQTADMVRVFELGDYARRIIDTLRPELTKAKIAVVVDCPTPIEITTRPSAIWQILSNLVLNAVRHAFSDPKVQRTGEPPLVTVTARRASGRIRLEVADNGVGVAEEVRRHIFDPFFTTRRGDGGSGLGLTIAYNLATRTLSGTIACESEPGRGARFIISFPEKPVPTATPR